MKTLAWAAPLVLCCLAATGAALRYRYSEKEAAQFVEYLNSVISVTSTRDLFQFGRGRDGGGFRGTNVTTRTLAAPETR